MPSWRIYLLDPLFSKQTIGTTICWASISCRYVCESIPTQRTLLDLEKTIASLPSRMDPDLKPLPYMPMGALPPLGTLSQWPKLQDRSRVPWWTCQSQHCLWCGGAGTWASCAWFHSPFHFHYPWRWGSPRFWSQSCQSRTAWRWHQGRRHCLENDTSFKFNNIWTKACHPLIPIAFTCRLAWSTHTCSWENPINDGGAPSVCHTRGPRESFQRVHFRVTSVFKQ